ncbi:CheR family methyltransferase [Thermodesulfobacteriota bacterium]
MQNIVNSYDNDSKVLKPINMMKITNSEFTHLTKLIYERFGINLSMKKRGFIVSRLQKLLRAEGFKTFKDYYKNVLDDKSGTALTQLANYISTNYTFFNRENVHFDYFYKTALNEIVNVLKRQESNDIRIWCAGCSTGEEPYMLMMLMHEFFGSNYISWNAGILASDISEKALKIAQAGVYAGEQVKLIPPVLRNKYLSKVGKEHFAIKPMIKKEVTFRRFNLMSPQFPFKKPFHIIFCRNVMIYFDKPTRDALVSRYYNFTVPGGYLFIGHSESLTKNECPYKYIMPALYRKV